MLDLYTPAAQSLDMLYSKLYIDNQLLTSSQTGTIYLNKTETNNSLASKVFTTG